MVIDIVKFFFIYTLVLFAFACGLNQLLWYFAELEKQKCYSGMLDPSWDAGSDACLRWRRFSNLFESCQSLFWASFGMVGIETFELTGIKSYTRFWGLLMFGSYSVINVIVLLNLLIAMMSNSYAVIEEHSDTEWKFARTKLWMSYFEDTGTLPPPFNVFPPPKLLFRLCGLKKKPIGRRCSQRRRAREHKYGVVMRALIWRYVVNAHSEHEMEPVTEDDVHELKSDLSSWRCELLDILHKNGMNIGDIDMKEKTVLGKKMKVWERRLMKDFQVAGPVNPADSDLQEEMTLQQPENENNVARWKRIARLAVLNSAEHRWGQVVRNVVKSSQIGKSNSRASLQSQQSLKKAMEEVRRLNEKGPLPPVVPVQLPESTAATILHVLHDIVETDSVIKPLEPIRGEFDSQSSGSAHQPTTSVNFVDETKDIAPLLPLHTTPPRVIKRKAPTPNIQPSNAAKKQTSTTSVITGPITAASTSTITTAMTIAVVSMTSPAVTTTIASTTTATITSTTTSTAAKSAKTTDVSTASKYTATTTSTVKSTTTITDTITSTKSSSSPPKENQSKPSSTTTSASSVNIKDGSSSIRARPKVSHSPKLPIIPSLTVTVSKESSKGDDREKLVDITPKSPRTRLSKGGWL